MPKRYRLGAYTWRLECMRRHCCGLSTCVSLNETIYLSTDPTTEPPRPTHVCVLQAKGDLSIVPDFELSGRLYDARLVEFPWKNRKNVRDGIRVNIFCPWYH